MPNAQTISQQTFAVCFNAEAMLTKVSQGRGPSHLQNRIKLSVIRSWSLNIWLN